MTLQIGMTTTHFIASKLQVEIVEGEGQIFLQIISLNTSIDAIRVLSMSSGI